MHVLTQLELRRVLCYNPFSGNFMWKAKPSYTAPVSIGKVAGSIINCRRYIYWKIVVHNHSYQAHRLAFFYMKGYWPHEIDHKDGDGLNNRWLNLRECTHSQNMGNRRVNKNNKLGVKGVYRRPNGRYCAQISIYGKKTHLGYYNTVKDAAHAYRKAAKKQFGKFARPEERIS